MKREENIFYNIIKNETSLTEVFCNLMKYKSFRDLFLNIVNQKKSNLKLEQFRVDSIEYNDFSTEKSFNGNVEKLGRGDLILKDEDTEYIFELKIRQYTELTSNQPEGYLKYLEKDDSKLFFIIPKSYKHITDIYTRWNESTGYPKENINNHIIFWEDILKEIKKRELDKLNLFINEFCNILDYRWFHYPDIKFLNYEIELLFKKQKNKKEGLLMLLDASMPKIISKLFKVVEETKIEVMKEDTKTDEYYGYIVKDKDIPKEIQVWFGVDFKIWEKDKFPLTIQVYSDNMETMEKIKNIVCLTTFRYEDEEETTYIGLEKDIFKNQEDNIVEIFTNEIHKIVEIVKRT